jgi:hypothetical protein
MPNMPNATPASMRKPKEPSAFVRNLMNRSQRPVLIAGAEARAIALAKSRFSRLPKEPEDARLTGVTRSLDRRLLALNLRGSLQNVLVDERMMNEALTA